MLLVIWRSEVWDFVLGFFVFLEQNPDPSIAKYQCLFLHSRIPKHVTDVQQHLMHTHRVRYLSAIQQSCHRDGLCDQSRKEFYSQHLKIYKEVLLSSPRRRGTWFKTYI